MTLIAERVSPFSAPGYDIFAPARRSDYRGVVMGTQLDGNMVYTPWIGLSTVRELALKYQDRVGLVEREALDDALALFDAARDRIRVLEAQVAEAEAKNDRIAGLVSDGYKVQRVPGRPPKKTEE